MAKATTDPNDLELAPTEPQAEMPDEFPLSLDEFCTAQSQTDRRVELLGAFHFTEKGAGRLRDTPTAYKRRLAAFANHPA